MGEALPNTRTRLLGLRPNLRRDEANRLAIRDRAAFGPHATAVTLFGCDLVPFSGTLDSRA